MPQLRKGVFETRFPVFAGGEHRIRVKDPMSGENVECTFQVTSVAVERQRAVRNVALEQTTGGGHRRQDLRPGKRRAWPTRSAVTPKYRAAIEVFLPVWNTWLVLHPGRRRCCWANGCCANG